MTLQNCTLSALDYTRRLEAALKVGDIDLCQEILDLRGQAMKAFELSHLSASDFERKACGEDIRILQEADRDLRSISASNLDDVTQDFRKNLVTSQHGSANKAYSSGHGQACVDRKA